MKHTILVKASYLLLPLCVGSCSGPGTKFKAQQAKPPALIVGVKPFKVENTIARYNIHFEPFTGFPGCNLGPTPPGVLSYEQLALPALLVQELKKTPGIADAYIITDDTPAVDVTVECAIASSTPEGFRLTVEVKRLDGKSLKKEGAARLATLQRYNPGPLDLYFYGLSYPLTVFPLRLALEPVLNPVFSPSYPWEPDDMVWPYGKYFYYKPLSYTIKDPAEVQSSDAALVTEIAQNVAKSARRYRYDAKQLRAAVYADSRKQEPSEKLVAMGEEASKVEREQLLRPITSALTQRIGATSNVYYSWKREALVISDKKVVADAHRQAAENVQALGTLTSMAGGMAAGYASAKGDTQMLGQSIGIMAQGAQITEQGDADLKVAMNKLRELNAALAQCGEVFNTGAGREITVRIYNKLITLRGSKEEMVKEFHRVVKEEMAKKI